MSNFHTPVLLDEVIEGLKVTKGKRYIDATAGGGGHGFEILKNGGVLLAIDQDQDAIEYIKQKWKIESGEWKINEKNLVLIHGNFREIKRIAQENGFAVGVDGILFDLGVSSFQLDTNTRGFSFSKDAKLDMRMSQDAKLCAFEVVNKYTKTQLVEVFEKYGEEVKADQIADEILVKRAEKPILTTSDLANIVLGVIPRTGKLHPATRIFQAIRIEVNDELWALKEGLEQAVDLINRGGRVVVISFHSLEDRLVKQFFRKKEMEGKGVAIVKQPVCAQEEEVIKNPRARSAKMRVFEKVTLRP